MSANDWRRYNSTELDGVKKPSALTAKVHPTILASSYRSAIEIEEMNIDES